MTQKPTFERSIDVTIIAELLAKAAIGETVPYQSILAALGRSKIMECYSHMSAARHRLLRDDGIVFGTVRTVGLKRLVDAEIVKTAEADRRHIRRVSRRSLQRLSTVERDRLSESQRHTLDAEASLMAMITAAAKTASVKKLEKAVAPTSARLPLGKTLEALR